MILGLGRLTSQGFSCVFQVGAPPCSAMYPSAMLVISVIAASRWSIIVASCSSKAPMLSRVALLTCPAQARLPQGSQRQHPQHHSHPTAMVVGTARLKQPPTAQQQQGNPSGRLPLLMFQVRKQGRDLAAEIDGRQEQPLNLVMFNDGKQLDGG